jgi:hypothetical protein
LTERSLSVMRLTRNQRRLLLLIAVWAAAMAILHSGWLHGAS